MRKQWFGDSRDYAKWNFVFNEALPDTTICYIAMARPDDLPEHINPVVRSFFDRYKDLDLVRTMFDGRYLSILSEYRIAASDSYFCEAIKLVKDAQAERTVTVFIDPDTGIEPKGRASDKHVRLVDLQKLSNLLKVGDKLIVYQHAPIMRRPSWIDDSAKRLTEQPWFGDLRLRHHYDRVCASDVCFLVVEK
jgi:hypothetical protein